MKVYDLLFKVRTETGFEQIKDFVATLPSNLSGLYEPSLSSGELLQDDAVFPLLDENSEQQYNLGDFTIDTQTQYINTRPFPHIFMKVVFSCSNRDDLRNLRNFLRELDSEVRLQLDRLSTREVADIATPETSIVDEVAKNTDFPYLVPLNDVAEN